MEHADLQLAIRGMFYLSLFAIAAALVFASLFAAVSPAFRRLARRYRRLRRDAKALQLANAGLKHDLVAGAARIRELEKVGVQLTAELHCVDAIRKRSDAGCARKNAELEAAQAEVQRLDLELSRREMEDVHRTVEILLP